jgi:hypothetical protein
VSSCKISKIFTIRIAASAFFAVLDTANTNRYVECGEVFARIPRGGPESVVLYWALGNEREALTLGVVSFFHNSAMEDNNANSS